MRYDLEEMNRDLEKLLLLTKDPHPGLSTWKLALGERLKAVAQWAPVSAAEHYTREEVRDMLVRALVQWQADEDTMRKTVHRADASYLASIQSAAEAIADRLLAEAKP